jgi:hypothetical protein
MPEEAPVTSATLEAEEADALKDVDAVDAMVNFL